MKGGVRFFKNGCNGVMGGGRGRGGGDRKFLPEMEGGQCLAFSS